MKRILDRIERNNLWFRTDTPSLQRHAAIKALSLTALAMIGLPVTIQIVAFAGFAAGLPISPGTLPVAWIICAVGLVVIAHRTEVSRPLFSSVVLILIQTVVLALSILGLSATYDLSFDGQWFNQEAVLVLDSGWNPLHSPASAEDATEVGARSKVNGYTKAAWIGDASVVSLTGHIEAGKALDPLLFLAALAAAAAAAACFSRVSIFIAFVFGLLVAANPTALNQLTTHMVDGDLGWGLTVLGSGLVIMTVGRPTALATLTAAMGLIWTIGTKFSGAPMAVCLLVLALFLALAINRQQVTGRRVAALAIAAVTAGLLNANPLVTNALWFEHTFYPFYGPQRTDVRFSGGQGGFTAMALSMVSRASREANLEESHRRLMTGDLVDWPSPAALRGFATIRMPGVHMGGWGPLFGSMILLGIGILALEIRPRPPTVFAVFLVILAIIASSLVIQYPWVARYVPQTWWIPLVAFPVAMTSIRRLTRALGWGLATLALATGVTTSILHLHHTTQATARTKRQLVGLGAAGEPIGVHYGFFQSNRRRLSELGIDAHEVSDPSYAIDVVVGRNRPRILGHRILSPSAEEDHRLVLRWFPDPRASTHRVRITSPDDSPTSDDFQLIEVDAPRARVRFPVETGRWRIGVSGCNSLGCGPEDLIDINIPVPSEDESP